MDSSADLWALMGKNCQKIVVNPKISTIFLETVRKQCLHASDFFHVFSGHMDPTEGMHYDVSLLSFQAFSYLQKIFWIFLIVH